jgi:aspartoacylase
MGPEPQRTPDIMNQSNKQKISSVLLVGGTHGNELTGIHLVRHWQKQSAKKQFKSFQLEYLIANPQAIEANKRYLEHDLNRCFKLSDLEDDSLTSFEQRLAKKINHKIGPKGNAKVDFIIDLHTSTANMQTNIVLTRIDAYHLQLAAFLKEQLPDVVITSEIELMQDHHFLESIADKGIVVEVGPIPQASIEYPCFDKTQKAVMACLDFVESFNQATSNDSERLNDSGRLNDFDRLNEMSPFKDLPDEIEIMTYYSKIYFPTDGSGNITASVHPDLIGKAYPKIEKGDPIFKSFDGEELFYQGEITYLAFINEAAYYDQKIAMCLCHPKKYSLQTCQPVE